MAAETVAAYAPISFHQDSVNFGIKSGSDDEGENLRTYFRTDLRNERLDDTRERPFSRNQEEDTNNFSSTDVSLSFKDSEPLGKINGHDEKAENKRKRNIRKRNRSDMSPEELRKLRERERKAQQNRRDRIRAQKRQAQGWHDDDAAWEAFLDQTDNNSNDSATKSSKKQTVIPSMVCNMSPHKMPLEILNNRKVLKEVDSTGSPYSMINEESTKINKQDSFMSHDTDSNPGGVHSEQENLLCGLDENTPDIQHDADGRRGSRRQFLPSEELEKLRKRERDAKRKQRERHRLVNGSSPCSVVKEDGSVSPVSSEASPSEQLYEKTQDENSFLLQENDSKMLSTSNPKLSPRSCLTPPTFHKTSPRDDHHGPKSHHMHYPMVYMPDTHRHHYSPTSHYFRERQQYPDLYYPRHLSEDTHTDEHKPGIHHHPYHDFHKNNLVSPPYHPIHHPHAIPTSSSPTGEKQNSEDANNCSPPEKKKMVSRNVDRKKLTEDQLEELRRRERDYQRERRARIRIEKAKSQATHDQYQHKVRDESISHYYNHSPIYHHHSHDKLPHHMIGRYESIERQDYHRHSPHYTPLRPDDVDRKEISHKPTRELEVSIPTERSYSNHKETELLQVVPKTRECEDFKTKLVSPKSDNTYTFPPESKKNVLENICSTLKKESPEWNGKVELENNEDDDEDDDEKLVIVQPNTESDSKESSFNSQNNEMLSMLKEPYSEYHHGSINYNMEFTRALDDTAARERITEDQLERRRRSNREAQRRRRARLKMLGNPDECLDSLNNSNESNDIDNSREKNKMLDTSQCEDIEPSRKTCRVKLTPARPDSLYDSRTDEMNPHLIHHGSKYSDHYRYYNNEEKYIHNEKNFLYPPSRYSYRDYDDLHHRHSHQEPPYITERYRHEYPNYHHYRHGHGHGHSLHMPRHHHHHHHQPSEGHTDLHRDHNNIAHSRKNISMDESNSPSPVKTEEEIEERGEGGELEPLKQSGRKRKQFAPRKIIASASNSPEEEVDVCNISRSPEEEKNSLQKVADAEIAVIFEEVIVRDQSTQ